MSSIFESLIDSHLEQWVPAADRSGARESLIELVNESIKAYVDHTYRDLVAAGPPARPAKAGGKIKTTAPSTPALENPAEATSLEDLGRATIQTLAKFCKERGLKVGGRKEEVVARAWRFLQGENSDEDRTPARRPKSSTTKSSTTKAVPCAATTRAGTACILAGTTQVGECWYCWKHDPARATTSAPSPVTSASDSPSDSESVSTSPPKGDRKPKKPKGDKKPKEDPKPKKTPKVIALEESD
jgi:hypothetical protein